jgi:hypothetical protein
MGWNFLAILATVVNPHRGIGTQPSSALVYALGSSLSVVPSRVDIDKDALPCGLIPQLVIPEWRSAVAAGKCANGDGAFLVGVFQVPAEYQSPSILLTTADCGSSSSSVWCLNSFTTPRIGGARPSRPQKRDRMSSPPGYSMSPLKSTPAQRLCSARRARGLHPAVHSRSKRLRIPRSRPLGAPEGAALAAEGLRVVVDGAHKRPIVRVRVARGARPVVVIDEPELEISTGELANSVRLFISCLPSQVRELEDASIGGGTY